VGLPHEAAEFDQVVIFESLSGSERASVFGDYVASSAANGFGQRFCKPLKIFDAHVAQLRDAGQILFQYPHRFLTFFSAGVVGGGCEVVFHFGVADGDRNIGRIKRNILVFKAAAIEKESMSRDRMCRDELVHYPDQRTDILVLGLLAGFG
jgi:hypothetical protein